MRSKTLLNLINAFPHLAVEVTESLGNTPRFNDARLIALRIHYMQKYPEFFESPEDGDAFANANHRKGKPSPTLDELIGLNKKKP